jgi:hypothetical protein
VSGLRREFMPSHSEDQVLILYVRRGKVMLSEQFYGMGGASNPLRLFTPEQAIKFALEMLKCALRAKLQIH